MPKTSSPDCIPMVILKNYEAETSYIIAELFNIVLKESCFLGCWKISLVILVFKNVKKRCTAKSYNSVTVFSVVRNGKCRNVSLFWFPVWFFVFHIADLLTAVFDRIARAFSRFWYTQAVALVYPRLSTEFGMMFYFTNLN